MKTCLRCSASYADALRFCARDGTALEQRIGPIPPAPARLKCPTCGAGSARGRFCVHDGSFLEAAD